MSTATVIPFDGTRRFNSEAEATAVCPAGWSVRKTTRGSRYQCDPPPGLHVDKAPPKVVGAKALAEKPRYQLIGAEELTKGSDGRALVQHVIPSASLVVCNGEPSAGKSTFTLALAVALTRGVECFGKKTRQSKVAYWIGEGRGAVAGNMRVYREHLGLTADQLPRFITEPFNAREPTQIVELVKALGKCDVCVLDTLSSALPSADQNSSADMGAFVSACQFITKHTGATVIALHHPTKSDAQNMRGSGVLLGAADTVLQVTRQGDYRTVSILKQKTGLEGPWCNFKIVPYVIGQDEWGDEQTAVVAEPYTERVTAVVKEHKTRGGPYVDAVRKYVRESSAQEFDTEELACAVVETFPKRAGKDRRPFNVERAITILTGDLFDVVPDTDGERVRVRGPVIDNDSWLD